MIYSIRFACVKDADICSIAEDYYYLGDDDIAELLAAFSKSPLSGQAVVSTPLPPDRPIPPELTPALLQKPKENLQLSLFDMDDLQPKDEAASSAAVEPSEVLIPQDNTSRSSSEQKEVNDHEQEIA